MASHCPKIIPIGPRNVELYFQKGRKTPLFGPNLIYLRVTFQPVESCMDTLVSSCSPCLKAQTYIKIISVRRFLIEIRSKECSNPYLNLI